MQKHELLEFILDTLAQLARLATLYGMPAAPLEQASAMIEEQATMDRHSVPCESQPRGYLSHDRPIVDPATFAVEWHGKRCDLGPTILFRLIQHLAHRPGRYFTYDILMENVWKGRCSNATIRSAVKRLRRAMRGAGMPELATAIRGRRECYGVFLDDNGS